MGDENHLIPLVIFLPKITFQSAMKWCSSMCQNLNRRLWRWRDSSSKWSDDFPHCTAIVAREILFINKWSQTETTFFCFLFFNPLTPHSNCSLGVGHRENNHKISFPIGSCYLKVMISGFITMKLPFFHWRGRTWPVNLTSNSISH